MSWPVLVAAVAVAGGGVWALDRFAVAVLSPPRREPERVAADLPYPHRDVSVPAPGGTRIRGWFLEPREVTACSAAVLMTHGWGATAGRMLGLARPLLEAGHPVLAIDLRGHGRSGSGGPLTVRHYREDVDAAARFLQRELRGRPVVLAGHSMGAAASVLAAAEGAPARGVVVLAGPADVLDATATYLRSRGLPGRLLVTLLTPFWRLRIGEPLGGLVPGIRIRELRDRPVLVLHGEEDDRVPAEEARLLAREAGGTLHLLAGVGHDGLLEDPQAHRAMVAFAGDLSGNAESSDDQRRREG